MCIAISICMYTFIRVRVCECDVISVRVRMCSVRAIAPHAAGHVVPFTCQSLNLVPRLFPLSGNEVARHCELRGISCTSNMPCATRHDVLAGVSLFNLFTDSVSYGLPYSEFVNRLVANALKVNWFYLQPTTTHLHTTSYYYDPEMSIIISQNFKPGSQLIDNLNIRKTSPPPPSP